MNKWCVIYFLSVSFKTFKCLFSVYFFNRFNIKCKFIKNLLYHCKLHDNIQFSLSGTYIKSKLKYLYSCEICFKKFIRSLHHLLVLYTLQRWTSFTCKSIPTSRGQNQAIDYQIICIETWLILEAPVIVEDIRWELWKGDLILKGETELEMY